MVMHPALDHLFPVRQLVVILSLRLLPFAVSALFSRTFPFGRKVSTAGVYLAFPVLAWVLGAAWSIVFVTLGSLYYLLICLGMNRLSQWLQAKLVTRGAVLVALFMLFLLVPGVLLPGIAVLAFLVVGWELALSSYSYCVETSRPGMAPAPLRECLFFLLVNPTLVYTARGTRGPTAAGAHGLVRGAAGAIIMLLSLAVLAPLAVYLGREAAHSPGILTQLVTMTFCGLVQFLALYSAHSGLASLQIGVMRHLGWMVPERYRYPILATSPMDLWRRWNTYVRTWLEAYVFLPLARRVARSTVGRWGQAAAAIATLFASGLLHDSYVFAGRQSLTGSKTAFFLAAGVLLGLWRLVSSAGDTIRGRLDDSQRKQFDFARRLSGRVSLASAVVAAAAIWGQG
jgi:hypothetical protein